MLSTVDGKLSETDAKDRVRTKCHHQVHTFAVRKGGVYRIDLISDDFDAFLRLEIAAGKQLAEDDDGGGLPHAQIIFKANADEKLRVIVTTEKDGELGKYKLTVHEILSEQDIVLEAQNKVVQNPKEKRAAKPHTVALTEGKTYQIDLRSDDFDAYLGLRDTAARSWQKTTTAAAFLTPALSSSRRNPMSI